MNTNYLCCFLPSLVTSHQSTCLRLLSHQLIDTTYLLSFLELSKPILRHSCYYFYVSCEPWCFNLSLSAHSVVLSLGCALLLCVVDLLLVNLTLFHIWASLIKQEAWWQLVFVLPAMWG